MLGASKVFAALKSRTVVSGEVFSHFINMSASIRSLRVRAHVKMETGGLNKAVDAQIDSSTVVQTRKKCTSKKDLKMDTNNIEKPVYVNEKIQNDENTEVKSSDLTSNEGTIPKVEIKSRRKRSGNIKVKTKIIDNVTETAETTKEIKVKCEPLDTVSDKSDVEPVKKSRKKSVKRENENKINICDTQGKDTSDMESVSAPISTSKSPRKRRQVKNDTDAVTSEKGARTIKRQVADIEDAAWEPDNWRQVWENILKMRKMHVAPVDSLGCEECPDKGVTPEVHRYQTLVSVMLSSQTRDEVTYAATQRLIEHGLNVENILKTSDEKIGELIYPAGFWKSKVQYIKRTTQILKDQYNGDIPRAFKELCKLPGVGPKMANIVMSVGWNDTVGIAVDTHVHRISNRLGWVKKPTKDPEQTRKALESWLPKDIWKDGTLHLVGFGQTICKPISPKCHQCFNVRLCPFGRSQSKMSKTK